MRGQINNRERRKQIIDFSGLRYKNITPTDIDGLGEFVHTTGFFEIRNCVFVFIELKLKGTPIDKGQRLAFERIVNNLRKPAIYILAEHTVENPKEDVMGHLCIVQKYYSSREWMEPKKEINVRDLVDRFLVHHKLNEDYTEANYED